MSASKAAFDGIVVAQNEKLVAKAELLMKDPFGAGWMLIVRPAVVNWRDGLVTGTAVGPAIESWIAGGSYKERKG